MATRTIESTEWKSFFDRVARRLPATLVDLRVEAPDLGDQVVFEHARLIGMDFDPSDGSFEVATGSGTSHRISSPKSIMVHESVAGVDAVLVTDSDDRQHIVRLAKPLELPAS